MIVSIPAEVVFHKLEKEVVLLNVSSSDYFSLDPIGSLFWEELTASGNLAESIEAIEAMYPERVEEVRADLNELVKELVSAGLIVRE